MGRFVRAVFRRLIAQTGMKTDLPNLPFSIEIEKFGGKINIATTPTVWLNKPYSQASYFDKTYELFAAIQKKPTIKLFVVNDGNAKCFVTFKVDNIKPFEPFIYSATSHVSGKDDSETLRS